MSEVLIIGGGLIGLTLARQLKKQGVKKITILERGTLAKEASLAAAGMLAVQVETNQEDDFYRFCEASRKIYPKFVGELEEETGIDVGFDQKGTFYLGFNEDDVSKIKQRFQWQKQAGLKVEMLDARQSRQLEPFISPDVQAALFFPDDWQVENRKLLQALIKFIALHDIETIENTEVINILQEKGKVFGVETNKGKFFADKVVLTTGAWTSLIKINGLALENVKIKPIRGQMLSVRTVKQLLFHVIFSPRGYIVPRNDGRILVGATTEDVGFDNSTTADAMEFLWQNAVEISPSIEKVGILEKWAGLRPLSGDGLPVLGKFPESENLFIAAGHYRNGILLAPITGEVLAAQISGQNISPFTELFGVKRFYKQNSA